jgi:hypothetical protein
MYKLDNSIQNGIDYLHEHQLPNGEFSCYYAPDDEMKQWCVPDSVVFFTSLIASSMLQLRQNNKVNHILLAAAGFLKYQMMRGGVWNYFTKWNPLFEYSPADIDDTVFASHVLRSLQIDFTSNTAALLANRNTNGLFYTWFIIRPSITFTKTNFAVMARELKRPLKSIIFWKKHQGGRNDIDAAVNANVLFHLGLNENTQTIVKYLLNIITERKETDCDKWYRNPLTLYYFISRNYPYVSQLSEAKDQIIERIYALYKEDGYFGSSALETALAVSTLVNFGYTDDRLKRAVDFLVNTQQESGCWARHIFFYSGPSKIVGWGSEELVTAYCIEALNKYNLLV